MPHLNNDAAVMSGIAFLWFVLATGFRMILSAIDWVLACNLV